MMEELLEEHEGFIVLSYIKLSTYQSHFKWPKIDSAETPLLKP